MCVMTKGVGSYQRVTKVRTQKPGENEMRNVSQTATEIFYERKKCADVQLEFCRVMG